MYRYMQLPQDGTIHRQKWQAYDDEIVAHFPLTSRFLLVRRLENVRQRLNIFCIKENLMASTGTAIHETSARCHNSSTEWQAYDDETVAHYPLTSRFLLVRRLENFRQRLNIFCIKEDWMAYTSAATYTTSARGHNLLTKVMGVWWRDSRSPFIDQLFSIGETFRESAD